MDNYTFTNYNDILTRARIDVCLPCAVCNRVDICLNFWPTLGMADGDTPGTIAPSSGT